MGSYLCIGERTFWDAYYNCYRTVYVTELHSLKRWLESRYKYFIDQPITLIASQDVLDRDQVRELVSKYQLMTMLPGDIKPMPKPSIARAGFNFIS